MLDFLLFVIVIYFLIGLIAAIGGVISAIFFERGRRIINAGIQQAGVPNTKASRAFIIVWVFVFNLLLWPVVMML